MAYRAKIRERILERHKQRRCGGRGAAVGEPGGRAARDARATLARRRPSHAGVPHVSGACP
jgi:hypothetical protein